MTNYYEKVKEDLKKRPKKWLITGAAGFIGSHLVENLLMLDQTVVGLDNFCTGSQSNIDIVKDLVGNANAARFTMKTGDIRDLETCRKACEGVDIILHQAALGSVPRSIKDPEVTHATNVDGFFNMILAAKGAGIRRFVYASSSSVYGDEPNLPKVEDRIGRPLSPYALSKLVNEQTAEVFTRTYGFRSIGLRYFNVFGPRQDPEGPYAAVIPRWFSALAKGERPVIYGDGKTSRDFCFVANAVQANILAATAEKDEAWNQVYNVACGKQTTLEELFAMIRNTVAENFPEAAAIEPLYQDFRPGDIRHSLANVEKARLLLGYEPEFHVKEGLDFSAGSYLLQC
jgi:UDP-N-acetylglucosamine 4-epimerase